MFSAPRCKLGHSDLVSGEELDFAQRHLNAKSEDSSCNSYDLCPFIYMKNHVFGLWKALIRSQ